MFAKRPFCGDSGKPAESVAQAAAHFPSPGARSSFRCVEAIGRLALACGVTVTGELSAWPTQQWAQRLSTREPGWSPRVRGAGGAARPQLPQLQETASSGSRQPQVSRAGGGGNFSLESCRQMQEESRRWDLAHFTGRRQNLRAQEQHRLCDPRRHVREAQSPRSPPPTSIREPRARLNLVPSEGVSVTRPGYLQKCRKQGLLYRLY